MHFTDSTVTDQLEVIDNLAIILSRPQKELLLQANMLLFVRLKRLHHSVRTVTSTTHISLLYFFRPKLNMLIQWKGISPARLFAHFTQLRFCVFKWSYLKVQLTLVLWLLFKILGECWSDFDGDTYFRDGPSEECATHDLDFCGSQEKYCVGKNATNFVYALNGE